MRKHLILLFFIALFNINAGLAQDSLKIEPLHIIFQNSADSTIIFEVGRDNAYNPIYNIISKEKDLISTYMFNSFAKRDYRMKVPKTISSKIQYRNVTNTPKITVDINTHFNPRYFPEDKLTEIWSSLSTLDLWKIDKDYDDLGCPSDKNGYRIGIYDAGSIIVILITKDKIRRLKFYAPDFYEEHCPDNKDRIKMLNAQKLFDRYFQ